MRPVAAPRFLRYAEEGRKAIASGRFDKVPPELEVTLGGGYLFHSVPTGAWLEWGRELIARSARGQEFAGPSPRVRTCLVRST